MTRGKFITIEGTEGAGKSTVIKFVNAFLTKENIKVILTREPGGTKLAEEIRHILLHPQSSEFIQPETELLLMFAGRNQHIHNYILPALQTGNWVVSDRFIDASYAYQGGGRGINTHFIKSLDKYVVGNLYPDLTLLLDVPPDVGASRAEERGGLKDRIEHEKIDFFVRVREGYLDRAQQDPKRIKVIDASLALSEVQRQITHVLTEFMKQLQETKS